MATRKTRSEREREKIIQDRLQVLLFRMLQDEDNKYCVDCDSKGPRWASWNLGIFVCIRCAGIHRNLGVHISKVKSVNLDSWTPQQVASMQIMGNSRARAVYEAQVPEDFRRPQSDAQLEAFIRGKYEKKKYIAREWVPTKPPDLPEGWTALIEAEKQKKDIRSLVLPSHTKTEEIASMAKRERQSPKSPKEVASSKPSIGPKPQPKSPKAEPKAVESAFDLLSLNTPVVAPPLPTSSSSSPQLTIPPKKPVPANSSAADLLCLGDTNGSDFNDFVAAPSPNPDQTQQHHSNHFVPETQTQSQQQQGGGGMSKDSIMALFNQGPRQNNFMSSNPHPPGMQLPTNFGGVAGIPVGGPTGPTGTFAPYNNPFLPMSQNATQNSDPNNMNVPFGGINLQAASRNFLQ